MSDATLRKAGMVDLRHINATPAQTWNYLKSNDITLTVPAPSRQGDVYFALPRLFEGIESGVGESATAWVTSMAADARYIEVRAGERDREPIMVTLDDNDVTDTGIMVRAGATATVCVLSRVHDASKPSTSASLLRVILERDASLHLIEFQCGGVSHQHIDSVGIRAQAGGRIDVRQYFLGAGTCVAGLATELAGDRSRIDLACRYLATGDDILDLNHVVRQRGANTRSDITESGILDGHAKKALRATIDFVHGAKGAQGTELENVLVLSDDVTNKTVPALLCDEDDVAGNHGATIGSPGTEQMRYLQDRGLTQAEAEALYVRALFDEALLAAPNQEVRRAVFDRAREVLGPDGARELTDTLGIDLDEA